MALLLNPLLDGLEVARQAAGSSVRADDEVTVDDQGVSWVFEFTPRADVLGGGARVTIAKDDLRVLAVLLQQ